MPETTHDRTVFGLRVSSDIPVDDLPAWTGDDRPPDLTIRIGEIPPELDGIVYRNPFVTIGAGGAVRYHVPELGTCLVDAANAVVLQPRAGSSHADLRLLLDAGPLSVVCYRRGLVPMHASAVKVGDRVVLVAGASGTGKSTIAAGLARRGHAVFADDMSVLQPDAPAGPIVFPGFPRLKLWADALEHLGVAGDALQPIRAGVRKFSMPVAHAYCDTPHPVSLILLLTSVTRQDAPSVEPLAGVKAMAGLRYATFRPRLAHYLGLGAALVTASRDIASRVPVALLKFRRDPRALDDLLACIETVVHDGPLNRQPVRESA